MIARFHYDRKTLTRFLDEEAGSETAEIASHVEECDDCQSTLESLMQDGLTMHKAGELLRGVPKLDRDVAELVKNFGSNGGDSKVLTTSATSFLEPSEDPDSLGRFARYEILRILGRGGMGIVMQALDTSLGRHCAVKVLAPELASSAAARKRFSREAKSAAAVVHPHVVPIQTVDEHNGMPYLVMPVVEGQSLQQRVDSNGPLSIIETVRIAAQVAEGLAAAHDQGLVHRDIKPANVLLENGVERVQITDFGLARAVDDASMTRSGVIAGTPQYMSPEQAHGDTIDHRSDLFSLGSLTYFMLTGRSPFRAETTMGVLNRIGNDEPRSIRSINAEVPQWLEQIVMKLLSKSPDDRFQTAAEVAALLQSWHAHLQQPDVVVRPIEPTTLAAGLATDATRPEASAGGSGENRIRGWLIATVAFAFIAVLATVIVLETNKGTIRIESNSQADVPIRIIQGQKIVDELIVSQDGAKTRLRAGNYSIEVDGEVTDVHISGDRVTLKRGKTWLAKIDVRSTSDKVHELGGHRGPNAIDASAAVHEPERAFSTNKRSPTKFVPIQGPATQGGSAIALDPPSDEEIIRVLKSKRSVKNNIPSQWATQLDNVRITKEKIADYVDPPRVYPQIGPAQLHHAHYKCTVYFDEKQNVDYPVPYSIRDRDKIKVVYIDHNHFHLVRVAESSVHGDGKFQGLGTPEDSNTLAGKVDEFNRRVIAADGAYPQPPLTVDELLSLSHWKLQTDRELSVEVKDLLTNLGIGRYLPEQWTIEGAESKIVTDDGEIDVYEIHLVNRYSDSKVLVRKRYLSPPENFKAPRKVPRIELLPLTAAITEFNAMHHSVDGMRQPPLTINEVLAAMVDWKSRRNEASIDNKTFANFCEIALTHQLPAGAKLQVLPSFGSLEGDTFKIWSVRIVMPQVAKPGHTYGFLIRQQHVSVDSVTDGVIHWGKPNDKGLQAGVRLIPGQRTYQVGQPIKTEFVYRSISGKPIENVTIPNIFYHKKLIAHDSEGNQLDVVEVSEMTIGGAVETEIGEKPTIKRGRPLSLGYITPVWGFDISEGYYVSETNLTVTDGLKCFLTYVVSDLDGGELQTGEVVFDIAGHKTATRPKSKGAKLAREATLGEAVKQFNAQSAEDRKILFDPPIPEMTAQQLRKAFQDTAALYQQNGDQVIANALNQIAESGKLPFGLSSILNGSGPVAKDKSGTLLSKQIAPGLVVMDGPSSGRFVFLLPVNLIYNRFGKSSKSYGDLFESKHWNANAAQRFDTSALQTNRYQPDAQARQNPNDAPPIHFAISGPTGTKFEYEQDGLLDAATGRVKIDKKTYPNGLEIMVQHPEFGSMKAVVVPIGAPPTTSYVVAMKITESDFKQCHSGNSVTKVSYLPNGPSVSTSGQETLVSTSLDPGIDPLAEARRRGTPLVALTLQATKSDAKNASAENASDNLDSPRRFMRSLQGRWMLKSFQADGRDLTSPSQYTEAWIAGQSLILVKGKKSNRYSMSNFDFSKFPIEVTFTQKVNSDEVSLKGLIGLSDGVLRLARSTGTNVKRPESLEPAQDVLTWQWVRSSVDSGKVSDTINSSSHPRENMGATTSTTSPPPQQSVWDNFLNRCPAEGVAVIRAANFRLKELNQDGIEEIAKELGARIVPMNMDLIHPTYHLVKDRVLLDHQKGPATEKTLRRFIENASSYLTPQRAGLQPRSFIRFDCYIREQNGARGTMAAAPVPLAGAVLAQHEDRVLLLGPSSIAGYIEKGYKCLATLQAAGGELHSVPIDVVYSGNVRKANGDVPVESGLAVYEAAGAPIVPAVRLASPKTELDVGSRVLSGLVKRPNRRLPSPVLESYSQRIYWQTQKITAWRESRFGPDPDGFEMFDVSFDGDNVPTWATFTPEGQLLGVGALFDSKNHTASILVPEAIHATLHAAIPHVDNPDLKELLEKMVVAGEGNSGGTNDSSAYSGMTQPSSQQASDEKSKVIAADELTNQDRSDPAAWPLLGKWEVKTNYQGDSLFIDNGRMRELKESFAKLYENIPREQFLAGPWFLEIDEDELTLRHGPSDFPLFALEITMTGEDTLDVHNHPDFLDTGLAGRFEITKSRLKLVMAEQANPNQPLKRRRGDESSYFECVRAEQTASTEQAVQATNEKRLVSAPLEQSSEIDGSRFAWNLPADLKPKIIREQVSMISDKIESMEPATINAKDE